MKIYLIRHGATSGNLERRYIGRTDELLCAEGKAVLSEKDYPKCERVISSPMKRCVETARLIFGTEPAICDDLRECDFGRFEGLCYSELNGDPDYQAWIDSGGMLPFPEGESPEDFKERCVRGFLDMVNRSADCESVAFVVHGGTIMSIMERLSEQKQDYYSYMVKNGCGYSCEWSGGVLTGVTEI